MISVFDERTTILGEGVFYDKTSQVLYWLDILSDCIFYKSISGESGSYKLKQGSNPSVILDVIDGKLLFVDKFGLQKICLLSSVVECISLTPYIDDNVNVRANDGVKLADDSFLYGTMDSTSVTKGCLYYHTNGITHRIDDSEIGIPNSFISNGDSILISDSSEKLIYEVNNFREFRQKTIWANFSKNCYTPDGGCIDDDNRIYIAMWDGFRVGVFDCLGVEISKIDLPVPRPTNCTIVDNKWLYVTTAKDGLSEKELNKFPLSGKVFVVDLGAHFSSETIS